jgi:putative flavoprotein involved in K+ transport
VTRFPGLYFIGLHWLHKRKSALFLGIADDAAYLADQVANQPVASRRPVPKRSSRSETA